MRVGTMFLGEVENVGPQSIQTKFFVLGFPLAPMGSFLVLEDQGNGISGIPCSLHGMSVAMGYVRILLGAAMVVGLIFGVLAYADGDLTPTVAGGILAVTVLWAFTTWGLGAVRGAELAQREALLRITGLSFDPARVPDDLRSSTLDGLDEKIAPYKDHASALYRGEAPTIGFETEAPPVTVLLHLAYAHARYADAAGRRSPFDRDRTWEALEREVGQGELPGTV